MLHDQACALFAQGRLKQVLVEPAPAGGNGWMVLLRDDADTVHHLTQEGGGDWIFKDLDAATRVASEIGFDTISVEERF